MTRHFARTALYVTAAQLIRLADWLEGEQWIAHHRGNVVKVTRYGVSTLERVR